MFKLKLINFIFVLCCLLCVIWTIPSLIAFRNILLGIGGIFSLYFIYKNINIINITNTISIKLLGFLIIWVIVHFIFISIDRNLQLIELTGLWFRTVSAMLMASVLVVYLNQYRQSFLIFGICIGATVLINISFYIYQSFFEQRFILPGELMGRPFYKIETVFWGTILIAYANACLSIYIKQEKTSIKIIIYYFVAIFLALFSAFLSVAKNGILIANVLIFAFIISSLASFSIKKNKIIVLTISSILIVLILFFSYLHLKTANGWSTLINDASIGIQIEKYEHWKNPSNGSPPNVISPSTYDRIAWGIAGFKLILDHPLGYGLINQSFESWLKYLQIEHQTSRQTHSGWIDFGLAFGLPGIAILWAAVVSILYKSLRQKSFLSVFAVWICSALFILGFISEIFYKQFFEALMFWFSFGAVAIALHTNKE